MPAPHQSLKEAVDKLNLGGTVRHVVLCAGVTCCDAPAGLAAWEALKREIKDQGLAATCQRTRAACLRVCCSGPIVVVYPEGAWYHSMTADRIPRFVKEHLVEGRPIDEWIFVRHALPDPRKSPAQER